MADKQEQETDKKPKKNILRKVELFHNLQVKFQQHLKIAKGGLSEYMDFENQSKLHKNQEEKYIINI